MYHRIPYVFSLTSANTLTTTLEYICDLLDPFYKEHPYAENALFFPKAAQDLAGTYASLKDVVRLAIDTNSVVPSLSATLQYVLSVGAENLPTSGLILNL